MFDPSWRTYACSQRYFGLELFRLVQLFRVVPRIPRNVDAFREMVGHCCFKRCVLVSEHDVAQAPM